MNGFSVPTITIRAAVRLAAIVAVLVVVPRQSVVIAAEGPLPPQFIQGPEGGNTANIGRSAEDEVIYDVILDRFSNGDRGNDSGGISGGPGSDGFYPQHLDFFHGGDLKGLTGKLDYLQRLGVTAIRLSPIMVSRPVQGKPGHERGGYRGRWVTDFTRPDPHYGSEDDLKTLIKSAHQRGIKVYLTAVVNGTADMIRYRECHDPQYTQASAGAACRYRSIARYPYTTVGGFDGKPINPGFRGIGVAIRNQDNFTRLSDPTFALIPYLADNDGEAGALSPPWMNDLRLYNNRGNGGTSPESLVNGDIDGQDDLMLAHPRVLRGLIDIYKRWIDEYQIDGLHIAEAHVVDQEFLLRFTSAIQAHALSRGVEDFVVSASPVLDQPGPQAAYRKRTGVPAIADRALSELVFDVITGRADVSAFHGFFAQDNLYSGAAGADASALHVAVSNTRDGRLAGRLRAAVAKGERQLLKYMQLSYAAAFFLRGVPVIYYGDEQGFVSDTSGPSAEEDMLASRVESYNDNDLLGTKQTTGVENFDNQHPLYRAIASMAAIRAEHEALRGSSQTLHLADNGVLVVSRVGLNGDEYLLAFNFADDARTVRLAIDPRLTRFSAVVGRCSPTPDVPGSYSLTIPDHEVVICTSSRRR